MTLTQEHIEQIIQSIKVRQDLKLSTINPVLSIFNLVNWPKFLDIATPTQRMKVLNNMKPYEHNWDFETMICDVVNKICHDDNFYIDPDFLLKHKKHFSERFRWYYNTKKNKSFNKIFKRLDNMPTPTK